MRNEKLTIQTLQIAKGNAVAFYEQGDESQDFWKQIIDDCNDEIIAISQESPLMYGRSRIIVMAIIIVILLGIAAAGCNTVSGFGRDVTAVSDGFREQMAKGN